MQNLNEPEKIRLFAQKAGQLKFLKRTGWTYYPEIQDVESVADHSHRLALLTMLFQEDPLQYNMEKLLKFAVLHDLAEAVAGDITPCMKVSQQEKYQKEYEGLQQIIQSLDQNMKQNLENIWLEYEKRECQESKLVKDLDRYEMILQANEYENKYNVDLTQFYSDIEKIINPKIKQWALHLLQKRPENLQKSVNNRNN